MQKTFHISKSFEEAEARELQENLAMTPDERLDIVQLLREEYYKFKNESRKGFQRVYRIIKQQ